MAARWDIGVWVALACLVGCSDDAIEGAGQGDGLAAPGDAATPMADVSRSEAAAPDASAAAPDGAPPPPMDAGGDADGIADAGAPPPAADAAADATTGDAAIADAAVDAGPPAPTFVEVTEQAGLVRRQAPPHTELFYTTAGLMGDAPYMTGGAAAGDYDGDGRVDLYVTRLGAPGILYRNLGDGTFEDVTAAVGLDLPGYHGVGCGFGDIDNDGDPDLYVTTLASTRFRLFINRVAEDGSFSEEAEARGAAVSSAGARQGYSVSFGDYDRDGFLDLHTTEWQYDLLSPPSPGHSRLLRNRGADSPDLAGHFEDVTASTGVALTTPDGDTGFASAFSDLDDDGHPDLVVAADFGHSKLFWNDGAGGFDDGTEDGGVGTDEHGMGLTVGDHDGDGVLDFFVTSIYCEGPNDGICPRTGNRLYRGLGGRHFEDATDAAGVRDGRWGWGTSFLDFDNDGDLDLVMTNGIRFQGIRFAGFYLDPMRLWENDGQGVMIERAYELGLREHGDGKGLLVLDHDGDGDLDLLWVEHVRGVRLFENRTVGDNAWLRVRLVGTASNHQGFGARVRLWVRDGDVTPLVRELRGGNNFLGQNEPLLHFGLGSGVTRVARLEITWPTPGTRRVQTLTDVAANQTLTLTEP